MASYKTRMRTMATNGAHRRTRLCDDERSKKEDTFRESLRVSKSRRRSRRRSRSSRHHANHTNLYGFGIVIASPHKARCKRSRNQEHGGAEQEALRAAADGHRAFRGPLDGTRWRPVVHSGQMRVQLIRIRLFHGKKNETIGGASAGTSARIHRCIPVASSLQLEPSPSQSSSWMICMGSFCRSRAIVSLIHMASNHYQTTSNRGDTGADSLTLWLVIWLCTYWLVMFAL